MSKLIMKIKNNESFLRRKCKPVEAFNKDLKRFTDALTETMKKHRGIGIAANQVGDDRQVAVIQLPGWENGLVIINPVVKDMSEELKAEGYEGCLSIDHYKAPVLRPTWVEVEYMDLQKVKHTIMAEGLLAIALMHEIDHLNGKLFIDHLDPSVKEHVEYLQRMKAYEETFSSIKLSE